jgi:hypothetical protein
MGTIAYDPGFAALAFALPDGDIMNITAPAASSPIPAKNVTVLAVASD